MSQCIPMKMWVFLVALCAVLALPAQAYPQSYFNMTEVFSSDISQFPKWTGTVARYINQQQISDEQCDKVMFHPCIIKDWRHFLNQLEGYSLNQQLEQVNDYGNAFPYITDQLNWMMEDYWETPHEFLTVSGDCEDYAIAKYYSLRAMGVPASRLRVIVVQDFNLGGIIHAILGVYNGSQLMILDNQIKQVIAAKKIYHYKPIYGINEEGWWAYYPR